jgi:phosphohistidine phosphatase
MILHLVRHGKTNQISASGQDYDRELLPRGIAQSRFLGDYLKLKESCQVYCSSSVRTKQTLHYMNESLLLPRVNYQDDLYLCSRDHLLGLLFQQDHNKDIIIIGHNYGISDLASYLLDEAVELRTGEYIAIEFECENWSEISRGLGTTFDRYRPRVAD